MSTPPPAVPAKLHTIAVIGSHSDVGMISGGGSAQVDPPGGNAISLQARALPTGRRDLVPHLAPQSHSGARP
jgi:hypothetical protein